jgi:hypothetical protein
MDPKALLLITAFRHQINEPNIEAGFDQFIRLTRQPVTLDLFCDAVATCLREGLIREPIRLPEGALQCHWHLELTSAGVAAARQALTNQPPD